MHSFILCAFFLMLRHERDLWKSCSSGPFLLFLFHSPDLFYTAKYFIYKRREHCITYRGPGFLLRVIWLLLHPLPPSCEQVVSFSHNSCVSPVWAVFTTFFYSLESESKRIWILFAAYLQVSVYSQTLFIRIIRFIFVSKYSHRFAYKYLIWCKKYMLQQKFVSEQIYA